MQRVGKRVGDSRSDFSHASCMHDCTYISIPVGSLAFLVLGSISTEMHAYSTPRLHTLSGSLKETCRAALVGLFALLFGCITGIIPVIRDDVGR